MKLAAYELIKEFLENLLKRPANRGNYVSLHVYKKKVIVPDGSRGCKGFQFEYFRDHVRRTLYVEIFAENKGNWMQFVCVNNWLWYFKEIKLNVNAKVLKITGKFLKAIGRIFLNIYFNCQDLYLKRLLKYIIFPEILTSNYYA